MRLKFILLILILTVANSSCHKAKNDLWYSWYYVSSDLDKMVYGQGSWWIYQCDSVEGLDSSFAYNLEPGTAFIPMGLNTISAYPYFTYCISFNPPEKQKLVRFWVTQNKILLNAKFNYPAPSGTIFYCTDTAWTRIHPPIDSIRIGGLTFRSVQRFGFIESGDSSVYYTAPETGIVRKVVHLKTKPETWDLVRWHKASQ